MSTSAIIRFCDGNEETGAIVLHADGYPQFVRSRVLARLSDESYDCAEEAQATVRSVLAEAYGWNIFADNERYLESLNRAITEYPSYDAARNATGGASFEYTVHVVAGNVYY